MRCLLLSLFSLPSLARVVMRRRSRRVRRYAQNVRPAGPSLATGFLSAYAARTLSGVGAPSVSGRPARPWNPGRADRFRLGAAVVVALFMGDRAVTA